MCVANPDAVPGVGHPPGTPARRYVPVRLTAASPREAGARRREPPETAGRRRSGDAPRGSSPETVRLFTQVGRPDRVDRGAVAPPPSARPRATGAGRPAVRAAAAVVALAWGAAYLVWRGLDTRHHSQPALFVVLYACEVFGWTILAAFTFMAWRIPVPDRPAIGWRPTRRRVRLHLRRGPRGPRGHPGRAATGSPTPTRPGSSTTAGASEVRCLAERFGAGYITRADNRARQGRQHQQRAGLHQRPADPDPRRRPRPPAGHPGRHRRLLRRSVGGAGPDPARLRQPRLVPALRDGSPRPEHVLRGDHAGQGPPRRRLLVRLGGGDPPPGARGHRRHRHRDGGRGLPHHASGCTARGGRPGTTTRRWSRASPPTTWPRSCSQRDRWARGNLAVLRTPGESAGGPGPHRSSSG